MPIPEPAPYRRSNLTKQQRQEELAAAYGVSPMAQQQLTEEEYAQMKMLLARHNSEQKPIQVVDLNNPPHARYVHQKFPMMVYDLDHSKPEKIVSRLVHSEHELSSALNAGWSESAPEYREERIEPLSLSLQMEAEQLDRVARKPRKSRDEEAA